MVGAGMMFKPKRKWPDSEKRKTNPHKQWNLIFIMSTFNGVQIEKV